MLLQDNAAHSFLNEHRPLGNIDNVAKTAKKEQFVDAIASCFSANSKATETGRDDHAGESCQRPKKSRQKLWMRSTQVYLINAKER
ncbi:peptidyl-prolyl cis-trans isomerase FKBP3-like isoform X2 [Stigmatopora argus]